MLLKCMVLNELRCMDSLIKYDEAENKVYFSTDKLHQIIGFRYCLNINGNLEIAYMNGRKLNKRNALNILLTLKCTIAYFDLENGRFYCRSWRRTWNYDKKILVGLEAEAKESKLLDLYRLQQQYLKS